MGREIFNIQLLIFQIISAKEPNMGNFKFILFQKRNWMMSFSLLSKMEILKLFLILYYYAYVIKGNS